MARLAILASVLLGTWPVSGQTANFEVDVMAVLSKSGCNSGRCHGNANGRGGLKLSLRGEDPAADFRSLTRAAGGRRIDRYRPQNSLLLQKPTNQVTHQGGRRFSPSSRAYGMIRDWIAAGAQRSDQLDVQLIQLELSPREQTIVEPTTEVSLRAVAHFANGSQRDVTDWAVYETSNSIAEVTPQGRVQARGRGEVTVVARYLDKQTATHLAFIPRRADFVERSKPARNAIDIHIQDKLRKLRISPSGLADDSTFVRRAYLDTLGILPTADQARAFTQSQRPDKHDRLIDRLLSRPEFAEHWALKWSDLLRNEEKVLDQRGVKAFYQWIHDSISAGKPWDRFVRELITAHGSTYKNPPANFYRANRDPFVRAETIARLFLGTRLQCAKCHNHPLERWTQDDYYDWAAVFGKIDYEIVENKRLDGLDKNEFVGEQIVVFKEQGDVKNVRTGEMARPRMLGEKQSLPRSADSVAALASWLTDERNQRFAQSMVNLIWYHTVGRGLVEPVDDFRTTNPPTSGALLNGLAREFVASGYDLRSLVRRIMSSRTYRLDSTPNPTNQDDQSNFSRAIVRRLTAEQLLDAQVQVLGSAAKFAGYEKRLRAGQLPGVRKVRFFRDQLPDDGDRFLMIFGKPARLLACECERSNETTLSQTFVLIGDAGIHRRLTDPNNHLSQLERTCLGEQELIGELYWTALSRPPTDEERLALVDYLQSADDRLAATQDIAWAILNSKEFLFRR